MSTTPQLSDPELLAMRDRLATAASCLPMPWMRQFAQDRLDGMSQQQARLRFSVSPHSIAKAKERHPVFAALLTSIEDFTAIAAETANRHQIPQPDAQK